MGYLFDEKKIETNPKRETTQIMTAMARSSVIKQVDKYTSGSGFVWISFGYLAYCINASVRLRPKMSELDRAIKEKAELLQNRKGRN